MMGTANDTSNETGFYGKLPCRGDFLQRRAPLPFVDVWDAWLQECMHASKEQLQDAWLDTYLTGPVWRFVLDAGVCGDQSYAGILVPSVDRVGRYFPLTVVAPLAAGHCPLDVACGANAWFEAAEALVLDALEAETLDIDAFDESVARLSEPLAAATASESTSLMHALSSSAFPLQAARWHVPLESAQFSAARDQRARLSRDESRIEAAHAVVDRGLQGARRELADVARSARSAGLRRDAVRQLGRFELDERRRCPSILGLFLL